MWQTRVTSCSVLLAACEGIVGPEEWMMQDLRVVGTDSSADEQGQWWFELVDAPVGFRARGQVFEWAADFDLASKGCLYMPMKAHIMMRGDRSDFPFPKDNEPSTGTRMGPDEIKVCGQQLGLGSDLRPRAGSVSSSKAAERSPSPRSRRRPTSRDASSVEMAQKHIHVAQSSTTPTIERCREPDVTQPFEPTPSRRCARTKG